MQVVGFVGASGTGKSHRATWVAKENNIEFIIDDGLLIKGNNIVGGKSAKREITKVGSIKRALFIDKEHAEEVKKIIEESPQCSILILGTSVGMVEAIAKNLGLPKVSRIIYIEDVASEFEIKQALNTRKEEGKHVIPVPTFEIKKDFSGYFLDPLQIFRRKTKGTYQLVGEKSVVRPFFSYLGRYTISDYTIYQIVEYVTTTMEGVNRISRFRVTNHEDGIHMEMDLVLYYGYVIRPLLTKVRDKIVEEVEWLTALNIKSIDITAKSLVIDDSQN
ncbi:MAG TPA: Asp23/Gls24 family envelope stress response protein [Clostridiaceae bacterium]|nr:Asp23/Gls24 family envelope stress response protein [Clostridiaceae bacterium]